MKDHLNIAVWDRGLELSRTDLARIDEKGDTCYLEFLKIFRGLDTRRMGDCCNFDLFVECQIEYVASAEAISYCCKFLYSTFSESSYGFIESRACLFRSVLGNPSFKVELTEIRVGEVKLNDDILPIRSESR